MMKYMSSWLSNVLYLSVEQLKADIINGVKVIHILSDVLYIIRLIFQKKKYISFNSTILRIVK